MGKLVRFFWAGFYSIVGALFFFFAGTKFIHSELGFLLFGVIFGSLSLVLAAIEVYKTANQAAVARLTNPSQKRV